MRAFFVTMKHVILLHGFCENRSMWNTVVSALKTNFTDYHAVDLPGFGANKDCVDSVERMSDFVFSYMDNHQILDAIIIGHSMGGYVALEMLSKQPNRINGIGLIHSHAASDTEEKKDNRKKLISFIERNGEKAFLHQFTKQLIATQNADTNRLNQVNKLVEGTRPEAIISASKAMIKRTDHTNTLSVDIPFLWIIGKEDAFMPYTSVMRQAKLCLTAEIHLLDNVGHLSMYEAPEQTQDIIAGFVESV